ncbi:MAG: AraC family transcriptional regulator ligand-binding domain-containing protein [Pseudomonadota bacterium]
MQHKIARTFVDEALGSGQRAGIDIAQLLEDLKIPEETLDGLTSKDFGRIWLELSFRMEDEIFGVGKRPMRPGSATLLGHAVREGPTLDASIRRILRFLRVVIDEPYGVLTKEGGSCVITLHGDNPIRSAFGYRAYFLVVHGFTCWLAQEQVPLIRVTFPCKEPAQSNDYGDFFGIPVQFEAPCAQLRFDWNYLSRPVKRSERELKRFLRASPETFLRGYRDTGTLKHRIAKTCLSGPPHEWPDMDEVAKQLNMSRSTLHRRLAEAGQSFGDLKEELRRGRATKLLSRTDQPISAIASELGYAEESAFYRAFHRWYGTTPSAYRRKG